MRVSVKLKLVFVLTLALYLALSLQSWSSFRTTNDNVSSTLPYFASSSSLKVESSSSTAMASSSTAMTTAPSKPHNPLEDLSSVDFFACCGIGHRLVRMSLAHFVAKQRNFTLRGFWGWCGEKSPVEVFSYLFRPYTADEVSHVTSRNTIIPFYNEVPGFDMLVRTNTNSPNHNNHSHSNHNITACACQQDKIDSDLEFYTSLRTRFRQTPSLVVDEFVQRHFRNATVLGIHVRAGNGETGDFVHKGRTIDNPEAWVRHVCSLLQDFLSHQINPTTLRRYPPVLYIATDTPSMIPLFRQQLLDDQVLLPVLDLPQQRQEQGKGVFFGEALQVLNKGQEDGNNHNDDDDYSACLQGWTDTLTDMFLLSHADVVIAGKPSSFSQTLPMSLAFGRQHQRRKKVPQSYCEIIPQYTSISTTTNTSTNNTTTESSWQEIPPKMTCFAEYLEWCCHHATWIKFKHKKRVLSREFIKFQKPSQVRVGKLLKEYPNLRNRTQGCLRPKRGRAGGGIKDKCLPHEW
jgi:hypothetical protein